MSSTIHLLVSIVLLVFACPAAGAGAKDPSGMSACSLAPPAVPLSKPFELEVQRAVDEFETFFMKKYHGAALSVAVSVGGQVVADGHWGTTVSGAKPNLDTVYRIGSITKVFTDLQLLVAEGKGLVSRVTPAASILPEVGGAFRGPLPCAESCSAFTLGQLGSHTAGLPRDAPCKFDSCPLTTAEVLQRAHEQNVTLDFPPGSSVAYSNFGFALLGRLLEQKTGVPWESGVVDQVATPLGLQRTTVGPPASSDTNFAHGVADVSGNRYPLEDLGWSAPAGQMYSTSRDLLRLANAAMGLTTEAEAEAGPGTDQRHESLRRPGAAAAPGSQSGLPGVADYARREWLSTMRLVNPVQVNPGYVEFTGWGMPWQVYHSELAASPTNGSQWPFPYSAFHLLSKDGQVPGYTSGVTLLPELGISTVALLAWGLESASLPGAEGLMADLALETATRVVPIVAGAFASAYTPTTALPSGATLDAFVGAYRNTDGLGVVVNVTKNALGTALLAQSSTEAPAQLGCTALGHTGVCNAGDAVQGLHRALGAVEAGDPPTLLQWVGGLVFRPQPLPTSNCIADQAGTLYNVHFPDCDPRSGSQCQKLTVPGIPSVPLGELQFVRADL